MGWGRRRLAAERRVLLGPTGDRFTLLVASCFTVLLRAVGCGAASFMALCFAALRSSRLNFLTSGFENRMARPTLMALSLSRWRHWNTRARLTSQYAATSSAVMNVPRVRGGFSRMAQSVAQLGLSCQLESPNKARVR